MKFVASACLAPKQVLLTRGASVMEVLEGVMTHLPKALKAEKHELIHGPVRDTPVEAFEGLWDTIIDHRIKQDQLWDEICMECSKERRAWKELEEK